MSLNTFNAHAVAEPLPFGFVIVDVALDSLIAMELRNWITREFEAPIQSSEVIDSQDLWVLAQKVTLRSRFSNEDCTETMSCSERLPTSTVPTSRSQKLQKRVDEPLLEPLPSPDLGDALRMFVDFRKALCPPEEAAETERAVEEFQQSGLKLLQALKVDPSAQDQKLEFCEKNVHLERGEALQDHALLYLGHLTDGGPSHSQVKRAAIITIAALTFKEQLENELLERNLLNNISLDMETLNWMFHTCQEPRKGLAYARKHPSNNNITVMRRDPFYEVAPREEDGFAALTALFNDLIASPEEALPAVGVLISRGEMMGRRYALS